MSLALAVSFGALPAFAAEDTPPDSAPDSASDSATEPTVPTTTAPPPASTTTSTTTTTSSTTSTTLPSAPATTTPVTATTTTSTTTTTPTTTTPTTTTTTAPTTTTTTAPTTTPTTTVPAVVPAEPTARNITVYPEQIQHILATIRYLESRGIYTLPPNKGNASGAYQFIGSTWNNYAGYPHAYLAPPHIQDERAAADVNKFLAQFDNDVSMIPVMWYLPAASRNPALMDIVPLPSAGNVLTIREYQTRWLGVFAFISGQPLENVVAGTSNASQDGSPPIVPIPTDDVPTMAFPVLGPSRVAVPECDDAEGVETADLGAESTGPSRADIEAAGLCTEQAPSIVFGVKLQPIMAVADGVVTDVVNERGGATPVSVTITSEAGMSYVYAGFNDDNPGTNDGDAPDHLRLSALAEVGTTVRAGQIIGFMGDSEPLPLGVRADVPTDSTIVLDPDAVAPHLRLSMIDRQGNPVDAFGPVIDALFRQTCSVTIGPWSMPPNGSGHEPVTIETTDDDNSIDSEWIITSTGQVTAAGWAAMVNPSEGCSFTPASAHGPGADGSERGLVHWLEPLDLPTQVWVELALQDGFTAPGGLLRRG